jgi:hypothetical protein
LAYFDSSQLIFDTFLEFSSINFQLILLGGEFNIVLEKPISIVLCHDGHFNLTGVSDPHKGLEVIGSILPIAHKPLKILRPQPSFLSNLHNFLPYHNKEPEHPPILQSIVDDCVEGQVRVESLDVLANPLQKGHGVEDEQVAQGAIVVIGLQLGELQ